MLKVGLFTTDSLLLLSLSHTKTLSLFLSFSLLWVVHFELRFRKFVIFLSWPFCASDCVHNFLPIFIVCLVVYFAVHNLCLSASAAFSSFSPHQLPCSRPMLFCHLRRRHFLRFLSLNGVSLRSGIPGFRPWPVARARVQCPVRPAEMYLHQMFVKWRP